MKGYGATEGNDEAMNRLSDKPYSLRELLDTEKLQHLMTHLYDASGIPSGVIDLKGEVLAGAGWQKACIDFHRADPGSCERCIKSDVKLSAEVRKLSLEPYPEGQISYAEYRCENGLWDIAIPIVIEGHHLGNYFLGQFLYEDEEIDFNYFEQQAIQFHYDKENYLEAIRKLPRFSKDRVKAILKFNSVLVETLCQSAVQRLDQLKLIKRLEETKEHLLNYDQRLATTIRKESSVLKEDIRAIVHDLKTPLNGIAGFAQLIKGEEQDSKNQYLQVITKLSASMLEQIDEISVLADAEATGVDISFERFTTKELLDSLLERHSWHADQKDIKFSLELPPGVALYTNKHRLELVLSNLISNAFKYSFENPEVTVVGFLEPEHLVIQVKDNGAGIPEQSRNLLFTKFSQIGNKPRFGETSSGIGLYTAKKFAEQCNSQLWYEPNTPKGSVFSVKVPLAQETAAP